MLYSFHACCSLCEIANHQIIRSISYAKLAEHSVEDMCHPGDAYAFQKLRAGSHGVPSATHVSKFQHGGKAPTFEPQEIIKIWSLIIKVGSLIVFL